MNAGLDLCFGCDPHIDKGPSGMASTYLANAITQKLVSTTQLETAVSRIMLTRFRLGEFDEGPNRPWANVDESLLDSPAHRALAREAASASAVLAVNKCSSTHCVLPYGPPLEVPSGRSDSAPPTIAVLGPFANCSNAIGGWSKTSCYLHSYAGIPSKIVSILDAIEEDAASLGATVQYRAGESIDPATIAAAAAAAGSAELTVLAVGTGGQLEAESKDRLNLTLPPDQLALLTAVAAAVDGGGGRLVVVCVSAGPVYIDPSISGIGAILYAGYGGEEAGHGVSDIIFGRVSPSARFPLTMYDKGYLELVGPVSDFSSTSGVGRTYRYLNTTASPPLFYFGHGLSFSHFEYTDLTLTTIAADTTATTATSVNVSVTVSNVGVIAAHEVVQLYVANPGAGTVAPANPIPIRSLHAFAKPFLAVRGEQRLSFLVNVTQLATVQANGSRVVTAGEYKFSVGGRQPTDLNPAAVAQGNVLCQTITLPHLVVDNY
jgi:beta-glucosidase